MNATEALSEIGISPQWVKMLADNPAGFKNFLVQHKRTCALIAHPDHPLAKGTPLAAKAADIFAAFDLLQSLSDDILSKAMRHYAEFYALPKMEVLQALSEANNKHQELLIKIKNDELRNQRERKQYENNSRKRQYEFELSFAKFYREQTKLHAGAREGSKARNGQADNETNTLTIPLMRGQWFCSPPLYISSENKTVESEPISAQKKGKTAQPEKKIEIKSAKIWLCYMDTSDFVYADSVNKEFSIPVSQAEASSAIEGKILEFRMTKSHGVKLSKQGYLLGFNEASKIKKHNEKSAQKWPGVSGSDVSLPDVVNLCDGNLTGSKAIKASPVLVCGNPIVVYLEDEEGKKHPDATFLKFSTIQFSKFVSLTP